MTLLLVAAAGGVGSVLRYLVDLLIATRGDGPRPRGTLVVNAGACLALGLLTGLTGALGGGGGTVAAVVGVGLLGGYSTFSTASLEAARLLLTDGARAGLGHAALMLAVTTVSGLVGIGAGSLLS